MRRILTVSRSDPVPLVTRWASGGVQLVRPASHDDVVLDDLCLFRSDCIVAGTMVAPDQKWSGDKGTPDASRGRKTTGLLVQDDGRATEPATL